MWTPQVGSTAARIAERQAAVARALSTSVTPASVHPPAPVSGVGPVPTGTVAEILAWVDEDPAIRAQAAYDAEQERETPRVTLLAEARERGAVPASDGGDG